MINSQINVGGAIQIIASLAPSGQKGYRNTHMVDFIFTHMTMTTLLMFLLGEAYSPLG